MRTLPGVPAYGQRDGVAEASELHSGCVVALAGFEPAVVPLWAGCSGRSELQRVAGVGRFELPLSPLTGARPAGWITRHRSLPGRGGPGRAEGGGLEPLTVWCAPLSRRAPARAGFTLQVVLRTAGRIEPATVAVSGRCSNRTELPRHGVRGEMGTRTPATPVASSPVSNRLPVAGRRTSPRRRPARGGGWCPWQESNLHWPDPGSGASSGWATRACAPGRGFEPRPRGSEPRILPLDDPGSAPARGRLWSPLPDSNRLPSPYKGPRILLHQEGVEVAPGAGIEPASARVKAGLPGQQSTLDQPSATPAAVEPRDGIEPSTDSGCSRGH